MFVEYVDNDQYDKLSGTAVNLKREYKRFKDLIFLI